MLRKLLTDKHDPDQIHLVEDLYNAIKAIQDRLEEELVFKQKTIEGNWEEIRKLQTEIAEKNEVIRNLESIIFESKRSNEGNKQIINKLLNDLDRLQQDIEWYKRTYERRSLLGTLKEKLFKRI